MVGSWLNTYAVVFLLCSSKVKLIRCKAIFDCMHDPSDLRQALGLKGAEPSQRTLLVTRFSGEFIDSVSRSSSSSSDVYSSVGKVSLSVLRRS